MRNEYLKKHMLWVKIGVFTLLFLVISDNLVNRLTCFSVAECTYIPYANSTSYLKGVRWPKDRVGIHMISAWFPEMVFINHFLPSKK